jgi:hypothetical protein
MSGPTGTEMRRRPLPGLPFRCRQGRFVVRPSARLSSGISLVTSEQQILKLSQKHFERYRHQHDGHERQKHSADQQIRLVRSSGTTRVRYAFEAS